MATILLALAVVALAVLAAALLASRAQLLRERRRLQERAELAARATALERERDEQARRFEATAQEMESFSYSVSHDLRTPLRVVDGFANILLEDYGGRLDALFREHLGRIIGAAARMNAMIDALLALSRRSGGALASESVDLSRAAHDVAEELRSAEPGRAVELRIAPALRATGDPVLLRLVLQNLLGNAFKFSARAPHAVIEFGCETVDGGPAYFVRDNGAGFDMRFAGRLFAPFQRLHAHSEYPGTGVGLATVQRIVHRHGGRIWAVAQPGCGACFYFTLGSPGAPAPEPRDRVSARDGVEPVGGLDHAR